MKLYSLILAGVITFALNGYQHDDKSRAISASHIKGIKTFGVLFLTPQDIQTEVELILREAGMRLMPADELRTARSSATSNFKDTDGTWAWLWVDQMKDDTPQPDNVGAMAYVPRMQIQRAFRLPNNPSVEAMLSLWHEERIVLLTMENEKTAEAMRAKRKAAYVALAKQLANDWLAANQKNK